MKKTAASILLTVFTIIISNINFAQGKSNSSPVVNRNSIGGYVGMIEFNVNYERNIFQLPKSSSNLRMGIGYGAFFNAGEGLYINPSYIHLFGKKNSFLELDLGFKYLVKYTGFNPDYSIFFIPDFFAGYRYERPDGKRIFRLGLNWPTLLNAGMGFKF